ncbi:MAG: hypothetical protein ACYTF1_19430 [Planctomycetota bacterium]|jgi:hypothetical protein
MANQDPNNLIGRKHHKSPAVVYGLITIVVAIAMITLSGFFSGIFLVSHQESPYQAILVLVLAGLLVTGLVASGLIIGLISLINKINRLQDHSRSIDQRTAILAEQSVAKARSKNGTLATEKNSAEWQKTIEDIKDLLLLPEKERQRRYQQLMESEYKKSTEATEKHIAANDFHRARHEITAFAERFGPDQRVRETIEQIENAAEAARVNDIRQVAKRVEDMIGLTYWDDAELLAKELAKNYPTAQEPEKILERIRKTRTLVENKHLQKMHDDIQQLVQQRRWREALQATYQFIEKFPNGPDTDVMRAQLPTLEANAEIEARQEMETQFKELIQLQQYWEALELARRIIAEYPLSPQANALRDQLPRLEELTQKNKPKN